MLLKRTLILVFFCGVVLGQNATAVVCPNNCSNRGTCNPDGTCSCTRNSAGIDCSENYQNAVGSSAFFTVYFFLFLGLAFCLLIGITTIISAIHTRRPSDTIWNFPVIVSICGVLGCFGRVSFFGWNIHEFVTQIEINVLSSALWSIAILIWTGAFMMAVLLWFQLAQSQLKIVKLRKAFIGLGILAILPSTIFLLIRGVPAARDLSILLFNIWITVSYVIMTLFMWIFSSKLLYTLQKATFLHKTVNAATEQLKKVSISLMATAFLLTCEIVINILWTILDPFSKNIFGMRTSFGLYVTLWTCEETALMCGLIAVHPLLKLPFSKFLESLWRKVDIDSLPASSESIPELSLKRESLSVTSPVELPTV